MLVNQVLSGLYCCVSLVCHNSLPLAGRYPAYFRYLPLRSVIAVVLSYLLFFHPYQVQTQVHPNLAVDAKALHYVEKLIIDLLYTMCNARPVTMQDVIEQVRRDTFTMS